MLVLHPSDELYGADRVLLSVLDAIRGLAEPIVVLPTDTERGLLTTELTRRNIRVERLALPVLRRRYAGLGGVLRLLRVSPLAIIGAIRLGRRHRVRMVHTNTAAVLGGSLVAAFLRAPHLWHIHEIVERPRWLGRSVALSTRLRQARVVAVSDAVKERLVRDGGVVTDVLRNAAPSSPSLPPVPGDTTVLLVGRVNGRKGHDVFVEAARRLRPNYPQAKFRMVGGPVPGRLEPYVEIHARVLALDPDGSWLQFAGWSDDVPTELAASTIVVLPSTAPEPLSLAALEAMAVGRPVIASTTGGFGEEIVDNETGLLVSPGDATSLVEAIARLLDDEGLRERLVGGAHERLRLMFDPEAFASAWRAIYSETLGDS